MHCLIILLSASRKITSGSWNSNDSHTGSTIAPQSPLLIVMIPYMKELHYSSNHSTGIAFIQVFDTIFLGSKLDTASRELYHTETHADMLMLLLSCILLSLYSHVPISSHEELELLSTIREIRGPLRIQGWDGRSFPYLRNLRRIGHENGSKINLPCGGVSCKYKE